MTDPSDHLPQPEPLTNQVAELINSGKAADAHTLVTAAAEHVRPDDYLGMAELQILFGDCDKADNYTALAHENYRDALRTLAENPQTPTTARYENAWARAELGRILALCTAPPHADVTFRDVAEDLNALEARVRDFFAKDQAAALLGQVYIAKAIVANHLPELKSNSEYFADIAIREAHNSPQVLLQARITQAAILIGRRSNTEDRDVILGLIEGCKALVAHHDPTGSWQRQAVIVDLLTIEFTSNQGKAHANAGFLRETARVNARETLASMSASMQTGLDAEYRLLTGGLGRPALVPRRGRY